MAFLFYFLEIIVSAKQVTKQRSYKQYEMSCCMNTLNCCLLCLNCKLLTETIKKQEEYYDKMEDILKEAMNIFIQELSEIQIEYLPLTPNELKKQEKHIIETYLIEKNHKMT